MVSGELKGIKNDGDFEQRRQRVIEHKNTAEVNKFKNEMAFIDNRNRQKKEFYEYKEQIKLKKTLVKNETLQKQSIVASALSRPKSIENKSRVKFTEEIIPIDHSLNHLHTQSS
eukprot:CAMPEP_0116955300 /NCGR_PEP_ID=MMETSP0467-20121206/42530_1 /TAXON_ID=283647 /ORGANISM="Mesodinium pulex, Strain SPMC105" /LENGTH=113 /DNA_ID=CAMNT_0004641305 /DNA_START=627 /DNA_END=968 /DNA_ORIENTATION=-